MLLIGIHLNGQFDLNGTSFVTWNKTGPSRKVTPYAALPSLGCEWSRSFGTLCGGSLSLSFLSCDKQPLSPWWDLQYYFDPSPSICLNWIMMCNHFLSGESINLPRPHSSLKDSLCSSPICANELSFAGLNSHAHDPFCGEAPSGSLSIFHALGLLKET